MPLAAADRLIPLGISVGSLREFLVPGEAGQEAYWVITYRLDNGTGEDRELSLRAWIQTDVKRIDQEEELIPDVQHASLLNLVEGKDQRRYITSLGMSEFPIRRGEVRDGILIFPRPGRRADRISLFVDGLTKVAILKETKDRLMKLKEDHIEVARPRWVEYEGRYEERFDPYTPADLDLAEGSTFKERKVLREVFHRKGDEFHVHMDTLEGVRHQPDRWILVLTPPGS